MTPDSRKRPPVRTGASKSARNSSASIARSTDHPTLPLEGLPDVEDGINPFWMADADRAIVQLAATGKPFTADDLHAIEGIGRPESPNLIGNVFAVAHKHHVIERLGYCSSRRNGRNGSAIALWRGAAR